MPVLLDQLGALAPTDVGTLIRSGAIRAAQVSVTPDKGARNIFNAHLFKFSATVVNVRHALVWHPRTEQLGWQKHSMQPGLTQGWSAGSSVMRRSTAVLPGGPELLPTSLDALAWLAAWYTNNEVMRRFHTAFPKLLGA